MTYAGILAISTHWRLAVDWKSIPSFLSCTQSDQISRFIAKSAILTPPLATKISARYLRFSRYFRGGGGNKEKEGGGGRGGGGGGKDRGGQHWTPLVIVQLKTAYGGGGGGGGGGGEGGEGGGGGEVGGRFARWHYSF